MSNITKRNKAVIIFDRNDSKKGAQYMKTEDAQQNLAGDQFLINLPRISFSLFRFNFLSAFLAGLVFIP